jgi:hypothetical protein
MTVMPIHPNWREAVSVETEWMTEIITSRSGREQRRARRSLPRRKIAFLATVTDKEFRTLNRLLDTRQQDKLQFPDWSASYPLASGSLAGSTVLAVALPASVESGDALYLTGGELVTVSSRDSTTATLSAPLALDHPSGRVVICSPGHFANAVDSTRYSSRVAEVPIRVDFDPASHWEGYGVEGGRFKGREVFPFRPNWANDIGISFESPHSFVDYGFGPTRNFSEIDFNTRVTRAVFLSRSRAEAEQIVQFFNRQRGQRGEFYMPSFGRELLPVSGILNASNTLLVEDNGIALDYSGSTVFQHIILTKSDGTSILRRVTGFGQSGVNTVLTVDAVWGESVAQDAIQSVQWLCVHRFASDALTVDWLTSEVAQIAANFKTLEDLTVDYVSANGAVLPFFSTSVIAGTANAV